MKERKEFQDLLAEKKLKKTSQRALIWGLLLQAKNHPSVEQIRDLLIARGHRIGLATIYRTLKILLSSGYLRQSKIAGMTRYEPVINEPNHLHFICNSCGETAEFPSEKIERIIQRITEDHDFEERYSRYMISGLCKICRKKQDKKEGISEKVRLEKITTRDALELTLAIERLGYTFYTNASKKTRNSTGRIMFQRLAAEESGHLRHLQDEHRALMQEHSWLKREPVRLPVSRRIAQELFPQKDLLRFQVNEETSEIEALKIAMDLERRSHQFFKQLAKQLTPGERKAFLAFAADEQSHLDALMDEYKAITRKEP
jgi:Fur family transcriptional regulator, ferric uptake regulator